jgi:hypothetical protein
MRRRELLLLLATGIVGARAGQQKAIPVIGLLGSGSPFVRAGHLLAAFLDGLSETGYVDGEPEVPISGVRLSDWLHRKAHDAAASGRRSRRSRPSSP